VPKIITSIEVYVAEPYIFSITVYVSNFDRAIDVYSDIFTSMW